MYKPEPQFQGEAAREEPDMTQSRRQHSAAARWHHPWRRRGTGGGRPLGDRVGAPGAIPRGSLGERTATVSTHASGGGTAPRQVLWDGCHEPDLESVLADPIVALVMARDGLSAEDVASVMEKVREHLVTSTAPAPATPCNALPVQTRSRAIGPTPWGRFHVRHGAPDQAGFCGESSGGGAAGVAPTARAGGATKRNTT